MTNLEILSTKIREAIPALKEYTNGCIIRQPRFNVFSQRFEEDIFDEYYIHNGLVYNDNDESYCSVSDISGKFYSLDKYIIGREIMLNDVLLWFKIQEYKYGHFESHYFCIYNSEEKTEPIEWDLTKPYLKDQSQELIDFLLEEVAK
jgi:hypothetical protein